MPNMDGTGPHGRRGRGVGRPKKRRLLDFQARITHFKPVGIPVKELESVVLTTDEIQAIKDHDLEGLDHLSAAAKMGVSQPTFGRILNKAYYKIADALTHGKAIKIEEK